MDGSANQGIDGRPDLEDEAAYQRARQARIARQNARLASDQRAHDRRAGQLHDHVVGVGRWARPVAVVLMVLVLVPTAATSILMGQYAPLIVGILVCAGLWFLSGRAWHSFADFVVRLRHGQRP